MDIITPAELAPAISASAEAHAALLDRDGCFPAADIQALAAAGILAATLPSECGGAGTDGHDLLILLHRLGRGHLALGRVFEAHVNALRLVMRYGQPAQRALAARGAASGLLFALWVTDAADAPLAMRRQNNAIFLSGEKAFCSAAGHADRAVVTASDEDTRSQMLVVSLNRGERISQHGPALQGMRAATTGGVDFTGCQIAPEALLGVPGDYLREPEFSVGAWRSSAVALGGLAALLAATRAQLIARKRDGNPHQRARIGRAMIAHQTGWLWLERAARIAQTADADPEQAVAYINLARTAVEAAVMDALQCVQRSLGLAAFMHGNPVERLGRDLATYLRQPAPDEALDEAAAYFMTHQMPGEPA